MSRVSLFARFPRNPNCPLHLNAIGCSALGRCFIVPFFIPEWAIGIDYGSDDY